MSRTKSIVSNLHRFSRLNDKSDTQVFSFIVPTQLTRGFVTEVYSETFLYRNQSWVVKFDRKERHIGAYLVLRASQNQLSCIIDYSFLVLNRDHFTKNESFSERGCEFSLKKLCRGRPSFIEVSDLENRHFLFDDGKFLIELELKNCATVFEDDISLSPLHSETGIGSVESNYFTFGGCDWSVVLKFGGVLTSAATTIPTQPSQLQLPEFSLVRHSHFEHYCKIGYKIGLKVAEWPELCASVEQQLDIKGYGSFFRLRSEKCVAVGPRGNLQLSLRLFSMRPLSIVDLLPTNRQKNAARCYDLNQHDWMVQSDILGSVVKLRFFYMQIANVPRQQTHMVCWDTQLLPHSPGLKPVKTLSGPYCAYYSQRESDEGTEVATSLIVEQVCDLKSGYVSPDDGAMTVQVEWLQSHLLTHNHYHIYDDVARVHKTQMSREIKTLQSENYGLEKQLYKYQQNLAVKKLSLQADGGGSSDTVSLGGVSCPDYGPMSAQQPTVQDFGVGVGAGGQQYPPNCVTPSNQQQGQHQRSSLSPRRDSTTATTAISPSNQCFSPPTGTGRTSHRYSGQRILTSPTNSGLSNRDPSNRDPSNRDTNTRDHNNRDPNNRELSNSTNYVATQPLPPSSGQYHYGSGNYDNSNHEPLYDGSAAVKRQLPRHPQRASNYGPGDSQLTSQSLTSTPEHRMPPVARHREQPSHEVTSRYTHGGSGSGNSSSSFSPLHHTYGGVEPTNSSPIANPSQAARYLLRSPDNGVSSSAGCLLESTGQGNRTPVGIATDVSVAPRSSSSRPSAGYSNVAATASPRYINQTRPVAMGPDDDYDSIATRYEHRVNTQKKW